MIQIILAFKQTGHVHACVCVIVWIVINLEKLKLQ